MKGHRLLILGLVGFISFLSGGWLLQRGTAQAGNVYQQARLFDDVLGYVADYYVDSIGEGDLYDLAIDGLLNELADPYSSFLRRDDLEDLNESTTGEYGGLGIRIDVRDGWITVIAPIAGTPADEAGIETGDRIVQVDGESTFGWRSQKAVKELRGPPGTEVRVRIARPGFPDPIPFTVERALIRINPIQLATVIGGDVGYISLVNSSISETIADKVSGAVARLRREGATRLILDLRNNPGGLLNQGVAVADLFLDKGQTVVSTRGRARGSSQSYGARHRQKWPDMPIVVLVNGGTASASEIIAGALQDHDRALILGTPTFGKGVVQTVFRFGDNQALRLTTARWYTPNGRTIQWRERGVRDIIAFQDEEVAGPDVDTAAVDSGQVFRTDAGRIVIGGGKIRPDLIVRGDTLTSAEQAFVRGLGSKLAEYRDIKTSYALELKGANSISSSPVQVTSGMRREFLRRLRERGIDVSREQWAGARRFVDRQLAYEVERYVFGRETETRRRIHDDMKVQKAIELLRQVQTPSELLALVERDTELIRNP